jgi:hypothetical protein
MGIVFLTFFCFTFIRTVFVEILGLKKGLSVPLPAHRFKLIYIVRTRLIRMAR